MESSKCLDMFLLFKLNISLPGRRSAYRGVNAGDNFIDESERTKQTERKEIDLVGATLRV